MDNMNNNQGNPGQNSPQDPNQMFGQQYPNQFQNQNPGQQHPNQFQNQNPGQFQGQHQNQGQNFDPYTGQPYSQNQNQGAVNPETGNTYWESQSAAQNPNQAYAGQQNYPVQDTPAQFYQNYQQQMGGNSFTAPQPQMQPQLQQQKKKPRKKLVASLITIVLVLAVAGTAFAFKDKILDALNLGSKNPAEYYASIEQDALNTSIDKMLQSYNNFDPSENTAYKVTLDLTYDKATLDSLLSGYLGMTIADLESTIGISLDSIGADMTIAMEDSQLYDKMLLKLNNVDIITVEILMDTIKQELLMRIPELSPAYIRESLMSDYGMDSFDYGLGVEFDQLKDIKPEEIADFTKRYVKIITDNMKNVELTKGEELEIGDTVEKCNLLTVTIDEKTLEDILKAVIEEAKNDKFIKKLLPMFDLSEDEYVDALDTAAEELERGLSGSMDGEVVMEVYVNDDDKIIGRNIEVIADGATQGILSYGIATKGKESEYEFYIEDSSKTKLVEVTGSHTMASNAYTGEAEITVYGDDFGMGSMSFNIEYEDLRTESKDNQVYSYGKITLSSLVLMGMEFSIEYDVVDGIQHSKLSVGMGGTSIVGLDVTAEPLKDFKIPKVDSSAEVFDSYDASGYEATMNIDQFISDLSNRLGVDLNTLFESFMYPDYYYE